MQATAARIALVLFLFVFSCVNSCKDSGSTGENQNPIAVAGANPSSGEVPLIVSFDAGDSSDPDGTIASYQWDLGDGRIEDGVTVANTYPDPGNFTVTLTVTDDDGATATDQIVIQATSSGNVAPTAVVSANPMSGDAPLVVELDAGDSSDPDGSVVSWDWDFGDQQTGNGETLSHTYPEAGNYRVVLMVTDDGGLTGSDSVSIQVSSGGNLPPVAAASAVPASGTAPLNVQFDGSGSADSDGSILSWEWDFGDDQSASGDTVSHTYQNPGVYSAVLTVIDDGGLTDTAGLSIRVQSSTGGAFIVDHQAVEAFDQIPDEALAPAAAIRQLFLHASVGGTIGDGLDCVQGTRAHPDECTQFPEYKYDRRAWVWMPHTQGTWEGKVDDLVTAVAAHVDEYDIFSQKFCYLNALDGLTPCGSQQSMEDAWDYLRTNMEQLETQYPGKIFIWWSIPLTQQVGHQCTRYFNDLIRNYAVENDKILFDVADIESHDPDGVLTTDPGGLEVAYRPYCGEQQPDSESCHPDWECKVRLAKAFWWMMARIGGWEGD